MFYRCVSTFNDMIHIRNEEEEEEQGEQVRSRRSVVFVADDDRAMTFFVRGERTPPRKWEIRSTCEFAFASQRDGKRSRKQLQCQRARAIARARSMPARFEISPLCLAREYFAERVISLSHSSSTRLSCVD